MFHQLPETEVNLEGTLRKALLSSKLKEGKVRLGLRSLQAPPAGLGF